MTPSLPALPSLPSLPSFRDLNKLVVGIAGLIMTGLITTALFAVGTLGLFQDRYQVSGAFADTGGLKTGAPVRVAGINVGMVIDVSPDHRAGQVIITWEVDSGVHLGPDTRAEIGTATLLGGDFLRLANTEGGDSMESKPRAERRIPLERTKTPYTVINAFNDITHQLDSLDTDTINRVVNDIAGSLQRNAATIPDVVANLGLIGQAVSQRQDQLEQLAANGEQLTTTLASRDQQLGQLIDQAGALLDILNDRHDQLAQLFGTSNGIVNRLADLTASKRAQIESILSDVHTTLGAVQRQLPQINAGLAYAGPTLTGLADVAGPKMFNIAITGIGPASLDNLNKFLDALIGNR